MKPRQIPPYHLWSSVLGVLLVAAFYAFPRSVAASTSTAAPWVVLLAGATVLLMVLPTLIALSRRTGHNLIHLALDGGGRPLAILVALASNAAIAASAGFSLRQAAELVVTALYPHTPQTFAMSTMLIASALGAAMAPANAFWLASLYVWPTLGSILLLLIGNVAWGQFRNVLPATGHGILPTLQEVLPLTSHYSPLVLLFTFCGFLPSSQRLVRSTVYSIVGATLTLSLVILIYLMVFPLPAGLGIPFPLFEMSRLVQGGRFLERVDVIWIVVWTYGSVLRTGLVLMAGAHLFKEAFRLPDHRGAVLPLAVSTLAVALGPSNLATAIAGGTFFLRRAGFLIFFVLPLVVTLLAWFRRRKSHRRRGGESHA
ncbi:MAG: GerAB/ArcD/ProY family transporter [Bacillota bacterium]